MIDVLPDPATIFEVIPPARQTVPLVFASPHSGRDYPDEFYQPTARVPV